MGATKRHYLAIIFTLLLAIGIPGYLTTYTSPDSDHSEPQLPDNAFVTTAGDSARADSPAAPESTDLKQSSTAVATLPLLVDDASQPEPKLNRGVSQYVNSCQPAAGAATAQNLDADGRRVTLKIALAAPEPSPTVQRLREAAQRVEMQTAGRVTLKFYAGGIMGSDVQVLKKMQIQSLQGALVAPGSLQRAVPALGIYRLPMLFRSADEVTYLRDLIDPVLYGNLLDAGYVSFCFAGTGFTQLFSSEPIREDNDLRRKKLWVPEGDDVFYRAARALNVEPIPLPVTDLMVALQTRLVDVVPVTSLGALFFQWYTQIDYMTDLPLSYDYGLLVIDATVFGQIPPGDQQVVAAALNTALHDLDGSSFSDSVEALKAITLAGVQIVPADPAFRAWLESRVREETMNMIADGVLPKELTLQVLQILADYRAASP